jgi:hypothetical protein
MPGAYRHFGFAAPAGAEQQQTMFDG